MKFTYCSAEPLMGVGRILVFFASSFFFLSACAPVQPWERGRLAQAQMISVDEGVRMQHPQWDDAQIFEETIKVKVENGIPLTPIETTEGGKLNLISGISSLT